MSTANSSGQFSSTSRDRHLDTVLAAMESGVAALD